MQHAVILDFLVPYLDYNLKNNASAWILFNDSLEASSRISYEKSCTTTQVEKPDNDQQFRIFPNPAFDHLFITFPCTNEKAIQILFRSVTGTVVFKETISGGLPDCSFSIDISTLPPGYYLIETVSHMNHFYRSFIKTSSSD
jgi:hypothetical protein